MNLEILPAFDYPQEVRALFSEYTQMLIAGDSSFSQYLALQNYDEEIAHLEKKYGPPWGRLYLARWEGQIAGCIGLRRLDEENCGPECGPQQLYYIRHFSLVSTLSSGFPRESVFYTTLNREVHAVWLLESGDGYVIL